MDLHESTVGRQIIEVLSRNLDRAEETKMVVETIELSVRNKSANTLVGRAASIGQYFIWARSKDQP